MSKSKVEQLRRLINAPARYEVWLTFDLLLVDNDNVPRKQHHLVIATHGREHAAQIASALNDAGEKVLSQYLFGDHGKNAIGTSVNNVRLRIDDLVDKAPLLSEPLGF